MELYTESQSKFMQIMMVFHIFALIILINLLAPSIVHADEALKPIILGTYYDVLRDSSNKLTIDDILSGKYDGEFMPSDQKYLFFWHTDDTIWLRLNTEGIIDDSQETYWLEATDKLTSIEVYLVKENKTYEIQKGGISNIKKQEIHFRSNLFPIKDPSIKEIYIKLDGVLPLNLISFLHTTNGFIENVITYKFLTGIFYGCMTSLLIYNLFLFFSLKEKAYLFYVMYMLSFIMYQATMNSFDLEVAGHYLPEWIFTKSIPLSGNLLLLFMILFGREFLESKKNLPRADQVVKILLFVTVLSFMSVIIIPDLSITHDFTTVLAIIVTLCLWIVGLIVLLKGHKMARFYMVGWTVLLGSIIVQALGFLGIIPFHPRIYEDLPAMAAIFEAIFLSLALGDKINIIKKENQELQHELNEKLEHMVEERTKQLEKANKELKNFANTDQLTQLPNRFRLDQILESEFNRARNQEVPFSIILLDIDNFKQVNDEYGHQVGDLVLVELAKHLKENIRTTDTIGRWGGEEFLVICPKSPIEGALKLAEKLRVLVDNHIFPEVERKTCSFGVTSYIQGDTIHSMLLRCDKALYCAKNNGRNRVEYLISKKKMG